MSYPRCVQLNVVTAGKCQLACIFKDGIKPKVFIGRKVKEKNKRISPLHCLWNYYTSRTCVS